jgi:choline dehydrogenase-like flavoprotein
MSDEYDVLIIGAGQAGGAIANRLSGAGIRVVCLEQGDWVQPADYPQFEDEWELEKLRRWNFDPNVRQLPEDYPVTGVTAPMMFNGVGGSTLHYLAGWPRYRPSDFRRGTEHGLEGAIDWPITYEDLEPYYAQGDAAVGISGIVGDPSNPPRPERDPAIAPGKLGLKAARAFNELGWAWWPGDNAIITRPRDRRLACNACGSCIGCPRGSLGSADVTFWPGALANGAELRTNARVSQIKLGSDGRVDGATYIDRTTGAEHRVKAKVVVVAANGIGTPRLLLMSAQAGHPDGLANGNGLVGRHLMHHTYGYIDVFFDEPIEGFKGAFGFALASQQFAETDIDRGFVGGFGLFTARSSGPMTAAMGNNARVPIPWGAGHHDAFAERFARHMTIAVQGDDLPRLDNRVTLDPEVKDSSGLPAPHVEYKLGPNDLALTEYGLDRGEELARALGAREVVRVGVATIPPAWHLLGTARIGNSPEDSTCNKVHQTWEVPNLFVCDGSSLVTAGSVNPTSTITALALRCADYIKSHHREIAEQRVTPANDEIAFR